MTATSKLDKLRAELAAARQTEREIPMRQRQAQDEATELERTLVEEFELPEDGSAPGDSGARRAWNDWINAKERAAGPWGERLAKARRERDRHEAKVAQFVNAHLGDLVSEMEPEIRGAHGDLIEKISAAVEAMDRLQRTSSAVSTVLHHVPGLDGRDVPSLGLEQVRRDLRRLLVEGVPVPLPRTLYPDEEPTPASVGTVTDLAPGQ